MGQGWTEGRFSDGRTIPSTHTGRENNGPAVTCECFEKPCKYPSPDPECIANGPPLWVTKASPWIATRWMGSWMWPAWRSRRAQLATAAHLQSLLRLLDQDQ